MNQDNSLISKIKELKEICKRKNMRLTAQRVEIYKELAKSKEHPDAETLFNKLKNTLPNLSVDTVYRNLATLEELDIIFRIDNQLARARFDADKTPHHHFICIKCGRVYDIFDQNIDLSNFKTDIGVVKNINIQVRGICKKCL